MSPRTVERIDNWDTVPFDGGYRGLHDLESRDFSGVVTSGQTRLFVIRGTVVGILGGSIEDFENAGGTAREAPHPALPLLAVMQERSDEVRAKYYTEETPISEVDRTLSDGGFTGYVELSENVLSGDYYQVYHQGRSMSVAFVGTAERLVTDDEAFEKTDDEVGIFEVRPVEIDAIDVPEPADDAVDSTASADEDSGGGASDSASTGPGGDDDAEDPSVAESAGPGDESPGPENESLGPTDESTGPAAGSAESGDRPPESAAASESDDPKGDDGDAGDGTPAETADPPATGSAATTESGPSTDRQPANSGTGSATAGESGSERSDRSAAATGETQSRPATGEREPSARDPDVDPAEPDQSDATPASGSGATHTESGQRASATPPAESAADLEMRSIPSLDPARTHAASKESATTRSERSGGSAGPASRAEQAPQSRRGSAQGRAGTTRGTTDRSTNQSRPGADEQRSGRSAVQDSGQHAGGQASSRDGAASAAPETKRQDAPASREGELDSLRSKLERIEAERDELESERAEIEAERDRLQAELEETRAEVERLTERLAEFADESAATAETRLSPTEAIDETNLFVRYRSKGDATLETAHAGNADRDAVSGNLRLEYHAQFDTDDAAVGNTSFDDFLTDTIQYRFVDWLVEALLYEIRDTGHADGMADLYDALPQIDRAELNGIVSVAYTENGEEQRSQERFDVVVRDRMGNPLVVANINDSRDPATDSMMTNLIKRAERVGESSDSLAGAFLVTESFFEPEALETASEATSSGLFSRAKRKSFVNLSRTGGYHLCLVEARNREFHLAVPEL